MMLIHAKVLAGWNGKVTRGGKEYALDANFTPEDFKADDWEPLPVRGLTPVPPPNTDCKECP